MGNNEIKNTGIEKTTKNNHAAIKTTATMSTSIDTSSTNSKPFYGDLVRAVAMTAIVPVSAYDVFKTKACHHNNPICGSALFTVFLVALTCGMNWLSYLRHSNTWSFLGYLVALWVCAYINLNQWPYSGECIITNMYQGTLFGNLCNGSLTFRNHLIRMGIMFAVASYVSIQSPYSVYHEDVLPLLGGPMLMVIAFLAMTKLDCWTLLSEVNWHQLTVQGSRWVLSAIYMYHVGSDLLSMTFEGVGAKEIFGTLVKASVVACMGIISTGVFQNEIDTNAQLEVLVKSRTKIIQEKNDRLHMVELALKASETAIAITDSDLRIIWLNAACEEISTAFVNNGTESRNNEEQRRKILGMPIVEAIALESIIDEKKLAQAFSDSRKEDEICISGMTFRLEVSPYRYSSPSTSETTTDNARSSRFLVVLNNITAERAREVAEKAAQEEAMLAKAMGDSMVTLTVSCIYICPSSIILCPMPMKQNPISHTIRTIPFPPA